MIIITPKTDKHDGLFATDSLIAYLILLSIRKWREKKCKNSQKRTTQSQEWYWNSPDEEKHHTWFYV